MNRMSAQLELILGGARSGKSRLAEQRVNDSPMEKMYLATATAGDSEMLARIRHHQTRRDADGGQWHLIEEPLSVSEALLANHADQRCILVDCLTLWVTNCLLGQCWAQQEKAFFDAIPRLSGTIIFVSNEVGMGVVPMGELSREFVDASGFLHQKLAQYCQRVTLVVAGLAHEMKPANIA